MDSGESDEETKRFRSEEGGDNATVVMSMHDSYTEA